MINIVGKKIWYFGISGLTLAAGLAAIAVWGLNLGIDFTGGSLVEIHFGNQVDKAKLEEVIKRSGLEVSSIAPTQESNYLVRTKPLGETERIKFANEVSREFADARVLSIETIGPTIGQELLQKSIFALLLAAFAIVIYIAWAFRGVPKPASSWRFGITAIIALVHDIVVVVGSFAILGKFFAAPVDSMFITALLTIIGFSVHDTIVVYDRIRENLNIKPNENFASVVNYSITQTLVRSINTSFTVVLVLLPIALFGGVTLRWFTLALLIGIISGTYSSIFTASPLLVVWQEWSQRRRQNTP